MAIVLLVVVAGCVAVSFAVAVVYVKLPPACGGGAVVARPCTLGFMSDVSVASIVVWSCDDPDAVVTGVACDVFGPRLGNCAHMVAMLV